MLDKSAVGVWSISDLTGHVADWEWVVLKGAHHIYDPSQPAVAELGDSSINFVVRPWVNTEDYWDVKFAFLRNIKEALDAEGIIIPFPQRDVHLYPEGQQAGEAGS